LLQLVYDAFEVLGVLLEILLDLLLLVNAEGRWASGTGLVIEADSSWRVPAINPARHAAAVHLGHPGHVRHGDPLVTEQEAVRPHAGASGGVIAMHLV